MASGPSPLDPVTADEVLTVQFTHIRKGGYAQQEVDAFLDRIAATIDGDPSLLVDGSMAAEDVRVVQFSQMRRGGYDTREVDMFLDRVVAVLSPGAPAMPTADEPSAAETAPAPPSEPDLDPVPLAAAAAVAATAQPEPDVVIQEAPAVAPAPPPRDPAPAPQPSGAPRLHDPEGAARNLLAAAQLAADRLTGDADSYAARVRQESDEYAALTRGEADEHAARVTTTAETQAAAIREVAADEARRVAEETRSGLIDDISSLQSRRDELTGEVASVEAHVDDQRSRMLGIVDDLRAAVLAGGALAIAASLSDEDSGSATADDEPVDVATDPVVDAPVEDPVEDPVEAGVQGDDSAAPDVDVSEDDGHSEPSESSRSVFDEPDPHAGDTSAEWLDEPKPAAATIFDVESEDAQASGPPTEAMEAVEGAGDRFFDELRQADAESDALGPLDDDTDAALSAFFEGDEEPEAGSRWRDRFGPGGT